jgi:hypothetical protein
MIRVHFKSGVYASLAFSGDLLDSVAHAFRTMSALTGGKPGEVSHIEFV